MQKNSIISTALVVLILLAGALFWAFQRGVVFVKDGSLGFSKSAITNPIPNIVREPVFPEGFPEDAKDSYRKNIDTLADTLEADPLNFASWLDLAIYYRMVNDHEGAVAVWEYLRNLYPQDALSVHNLAEYYFHTAKDYLKAEKYYEESIQKNLTLESNYTDMYEMYRYVYKQDTNAAVEILQRGAQNIGGKTATQFKIMIGRHYRDVLNDKDNARKYLTEARDQAQKAGDRSIANELTREISAL